MAKPLGDLKMDRPPTYSSVDPTIRNPDFHLQQTAISQPGSRELEIHSSSRGSASLHIKNNGNTLYYLGHYQAIDTPDMVLHAGYDNHGPRLALASFVPYSKDLKIYIGGLKAPSKDDWDVARCAKRGILRDPWYRFETRSRDAAERKGKYYWQKTSDRKLGASRWSPRDYKLVRESDDEVVAVYVEHHMGSRSFKGSIRYREKLDEFSEMASMMVLLSLLEISRRQSKAIARAFPNTNSY